MKNLYLVFIALLWGGLIYAQNTQNPQIPVDPQLRYGKLSNGLTYYIRHNSQPKNRADFYLVQKVGSIVENEDQRGLAHFLEHMAFNGTKNFPDKNMIRFLERNGVKFGENLNAYTGFDQTVYYISDLPTTNKAVVDSALLILHDWAGGITLSETEIEKERGVIKEEWRTRGNAQFRMWEKLFPEVFLGSKYANRLPIGTLDIIENFKPETLRNYYKEWYRPDLQAVIVVGDISEDQVVAQLETIFKDLSVPKNAPEREYFSVPNNEAPIIAVTTDKEATRVMIDIYFKHDPLSKELYGTELGAIMNYVRQIISLMINERFSDMARKIDPPFLQAQASIDEFIVAKTKDAFNVSCICKEDGIENAFKALIREVERIRRFGFTDTEYDRARKKLLRFYESNYNDRFNRENHLFAQEYTAHFIDGGYIPGIALEYDLIKKIASSITLKDIGNYTNMFIDSKNVVISVTGPEKEIIPYPSEYTLLTWYNTTKDEKVTPYKDLVKDVPLIAKKPSGGKIISEIQDSFSNATLFTLSNGIKVIAKPTIFKTDEILMTGFAPGGISVFDKKDLINAKVFNSVIGLSGIGDFKKSELEKLLSGKKVSVSKELSYDKEIFRGISSPADIETLMQLINLSFQPPLRDTDAYNSYLAKLENQIRNQQLNPMVIFSDTLSSVVYPDNPLKKRITLEDINKIDYNRILKMYKEVFRSGDDFTFIFVGNIDMEQFREEITSYLATIPSSKHHLKTKEIDLSIAKGEIRKTFFQPMQTPKATTVNLISGTLAYDLPNLIRMSVLANALDIIYTEKVREEKSGTYGVSVSGWISTFPKGQSGLQIYFDTDPALQQELNTIIMNELREVAEKGINKTTLATVQENLQKNYQQRIEENSYWLNVIQTYYSEGIDLSADYIKIVSSLTSNDIQQFARELLEQGNNIEVVMVPEKENE
ncbi:MAG: insulinase family protein [Bacteroidales bacterium]|nr:insulinase family protein [Bacteroidales bacterium]